MNRLFIIRGLPGSGKSTLAKTILDKHDFAMFLMEADTFFTPPGRIDDVNAEYTFDRRRLGAAHDMCYGQALHVLHHGHDVVVANTFSTRKEIERYIKGVRRAGIDMETGFPRVIHCTETFENVHRVPKAAIARMRDRWEPWEGELMYTGEEYV